MATTTSSSSSSLLRQSPAAFHPKPTTRSPINLSLTRKLPTFRISHKPHFTKLPKSKPSSAGASGAKTNASAASSYAAALADVAKATNTLEATSTDVENISTIFSDPPVADFFSSPVISLETKREVLDQITTAAKFQPHTINFLNILLDMKRIDIIKEILKEFEIVYNKLTDTELAIVTSVVPLESGHLEQIANGVQKLTGSKNVKIKTVLDPSLVAGFTIRYGNSGSKLIDMSVKKQLEEIAAQLDLGDIKLAV